MTKKNEQMLSYDYQWSPLDPKKDADLYTCDAYFRKRVYSDLTHPMVPTVDPDYVLRPALVCEISFGTEPPSGMRPYPILCVGPKGTGKTSLILQIAARLNIPVYRINCNVGTNVRHFKGKVTARQGRTEFEPGIATRAMEEGAWLVIDEISGATPPVALSLFPILEHDGEVLLEEAEPPRYVVRHPDFRVFATDNTIGALNDETRFAYSGTRPMVNEALLDRFGGCVEVGYLERKQEAHAIASAAPGVDPIFVQGIVRCLAALRNSPIDFGFSTRMGINWAQRAAVGARGADGQCKPLRSRDMLQAARSGFLNSMRSQVNRESAEGIITRIFPTEKAPTEKPEVS